MEEQYNEKDADHSYICVTGRSGIYGMHGAGGGAGTDGHARANACCDTHTDADLPKLSCNFCNIYVIYKSGRGPRVEDTWPKEMSDL